MPGQRERRLLVIADDIGMGPNTSAGILQLGSQGVLTGSALLVNSPHTRDAIRRWRQLGASLELGWHPNLTLDTPLASPAQVPSLIQSDGTFWPLPIFLRRWFLGLLEPGEIEVELRLQLHRFADLVGHYPRFLNCHQHTCLFSPIGEILFNVLMELPFRPYVRRIQEPWNVVRTLPGARLKRALLGWLGRRMSRLQEGLGFPGNDWLAGIASPACIENPEFFIRWLEAMPGDTVEIMCHPGHFDATLIGRDCTETDGLLQQRVNELRWLSHPSFLEAVSAAGFRLVSPSEFIHADRRVAKCA
ncbi:MAG: ChbG/HpnK family deacetylase [Planctomycetes bacterium]|nr:ChbG/HpnK family deacetylase [Planctomycetota bacterium]